MSRTAVCLAGPPTIFPGGRMEDAEPRCDEEAELEALSAELEQQLARLRMRAVKTSRRDRPYFSQMTTIEIVPGRVVGRVAPSRPDGAPDVHGTPAGQRALNVFDISDRPAYTSTASI